MKNFLKRKFFVNRHIDALGIEYGHISKQPFIAVRANHCNVALCISKLRKRCSERLGFAVILLIADVNNFRAAFVTERRTALAITDRFFQHLLEVANRRYFIIGVVLFVILVHSIPFPFLITA